MATDTLTLEQKLRAFVTCHAEIKVAKELEAGLAEVAATLESEIKELYAAGGVQSVKVDGKTVYLHRQIWSSAETGKGEDLATVLALLGKGDLVKTSVSAQTLSSLVREYERDNDDMPILPDELKGLVRVSDKVSIRLRAN